MKTFVVFAVSIVLVSIVFCPMVTAFPTLPADLQMVQPDPSLPKELLAFFGKWEADKFFVIVEKIDEEKASVYMWQSIFSHPGMYNEASQWHRFVAKPVSSSGSYSLTFALGPLCPFALPNISSMDDTHLILRFKQPTPDYTGPTEVTLTPPSE
jgi:hypothetical protein